MRYGPLLLLLLFAASTACAQPAPSRPTRGQRLIVGAAATAGALVGAFVGVEVGMAACGYGASCEGFIPPQAVTGGLVGGVAGSVLFAYGAKRHVGGKGSVLLATAGALLGGVGVAMLLGPIDPYGYGTILGGLAGGIGGGSLGYGIPTGMPPRRRALHLHPATGPDGGRGIAARIAL